MEEVEFGEKNAAQKILSFSKKNMNELSKNMKKDLHLDAAQRVFNEIKQNEKYSFHRYWWCWHGWYC